MAIDQALRFDSTGRTARVTAERRLRERLETVLFTRVGERVNRPDFGSSLHQILFAPASPEVATAVQYLVQGALQRWLGGEAQVEGVEVAARDAALVVTVSYRPAGAHQPEVARFELPEGGA